MSAESFSKRDLIRHVLALADQQGGQQALARALGLTENLVSRACTGVSIAPKLTDALGVDFDVDRGRYVQVRPPVFVSGVDPVEALRSQLADAKLSLKAAHAKVLHLENEVHRLKVKMRAAA